VTREMPNKLGDRIDGALELLDRQLLDVDGRMLGKVDDIELTQTDQGLTVTAVLTGQVALMHRLGGRLGNELVTKYVELRPSETNRSRPWRILMEDVERLDSAVHLRVDREESTRRDVETFRLGTLTGMDVLEPDGRRVGRVLDARFAPGADGRLVIEGLVVGHGLPGSLLGYDRRKGMGPAVVRHIVGFLHRHTRVVGVEDLQILWNNEEVRLTGGIAELGRTPVPGSSRKEVGEGPRKADTP
jgi:sporulation protein YlmC with PRC-barrel domain